MVYARHVPKLVSLLSVNECLSEGDDRTNGILRKVKFDNRPGEELTHRREAAVSSYGDSQSADRGAVLPCASSTEDERHI